MLVLTRRIGEAILIDGGIRVSIVAMRGKQVRLGIEAPPVVNIHREEVLVRKQLGISRETNDGTSPETQPRPPS